MRFDDRFLEEIKARVRLSDVIGKTVKLKRQGREFVGLSPFGKEKSPSFFVNDDKGFFHDFSSGKHGDLIAFFQETERLTFVEAVERLAAEAGVPLPTPDPEQARQDQQRTGLIDWLEIAGQWYSAQLRQPWGRAATAYLERRGLSPEVWSQFGLGYAPADRTALKDHLISKGARAPLLIDAGLLAAPEGGGAPFDRFRDRIMFPITDTRGRIVSFGGRALDPAARAKYLNGPETSVFSKGKMLYGLSLARKLLHQPGVVAAPSLIVVEGYMDVIACQRAGVAAVAPLGTALTEAQLELLWRLHPEPTLCFDGDAAGRRAAHRAIDQALPRLKPDQSLRFAELEGGKDPDDVLRTAGPSALKAQLTTTMPLIDALWRRERDLSPLDRPEAVAGLKQRLRQYAGQIADTELAIAYREALLQRFEAERPAPAPRTASTVRWTGARDRLPPPTSALARTRDARHHRGLDPVVAALAKGLIEDPERLDLQLEAVGAHGLHDPALHALAEALVELRLQSDHLDSVSLAHHLAERGFTPLLIDIDRAAAQSGAPFLKPDVTLVDARSQWSHAFGLLSRMAALEDAILSAKAALGSRDDMAAFERLKAERDHLKQAVRLGTFWLDAPAADPYQP